MPNNAVIIEFLMFIDLEKSLRLYDMCSINWNVVLFQNYSQFFLQPIILIIIVT